MSATTSFNPFPGLRPFRTDEDYLFFGREGQSEELLRRLRLNRFLSVVGTSGSGKSSLVRAGLLPYLYGGFMSGAGSHWRVAVFRPGSDPIGNLAKSLNDPSVIGDPADNEEAAKRRALLLEVTLRRSGLGLIDAVKLSPLPERDNILIVADQFEELFRFADAASSIRKEEDAAAFVKLLVEAGRQSEVAVYVVITMRSDFIGDCARFSDLPEAVTAGLYLIPRMTREQRRAAIEGPVQVGSAAISRRLINRVLNDGGDDPDQLPSLQHALMRTWAYWDEHHHADEPIDVDDYLAVGGISEALSRHAEEAYAELPDERHRSIAKRLFQCLTEKGSDNREVRRPTKIAAVAEMAEAQLAEVIAVIEYFRVEGRSFLMPPSDVPLDGTSVADISHESLIRGWERLRTWVEEESDSARIYRRLAETAALHSQEKAGLWHDPDLSNALAWQEKEKPNAAWAHCYHPGFDQAIAFLQESRKNRDDEQADKERHRREELQKVRLFAGAITALFLVALGLSFWALREKNVAQSKTHEAEKSAAEAKERTIAAVRAETKAQRAALKAEAEGRRAEAEAAAARSAREREMSKTREAELALGRAQSEKDRADTNSKAALEYAGSTIREWQALSGAITEQHDGQDFYEKLLLGAEVVHKTIMKNTPDSLDAMVFWVIDSVGIPDLHFRQKRTRQAQAECAEHEVTGRQWAQEENYFKRALAADLLSYTAETRMKMGDNQLALADARLAGTVADTVVSAANLKDDRSWRDLGVAYSQAALVEQHYEHWVEALHDYESAVAARGKIADLSADLRHSLLMDMRRAANSQVALKRKEDALATYKKAMQVAEATAVKASADPNASHSVREQALVDAAGVYVERGDAEVQWKQDTDAEQDFKLARSKIESLASQSPGVDFQLSLADERLGNIWNARALVEKDAARRSEILGRALTFHDKALEERVRVEKSDKSPQAELNLGFSEYNLGRDYFSLGDLPHSIEHYKAAAGAYRLAAQLNPGDASWRRVADTWRDVALVDQKAGNSDELLKDYQGAAEASKKVVNPNASVNSMLLSDLEKIADLEATSHAPGALGAYAEAIQFAEKLTAATATPELIHRLFWLYIARGDLQTQEKSYPEGAKAYELARSQALRLDEKTENGQSDRAIADERVGNLFLTRSASEKDEEGRKQTLTQAVQFHLSALDQFRRIKRNEAVAVEENDLGRDYRLLKEFDKARGHYQASILAYREEARLLRSDKTTRDVANVYKELSLLGQEAEQYVAAQAALDAAIAFLEPLMTDSKTAAAAKSLLADTFGSRSWNDLFLGNFPQAIKDADKGLGYDPTQIWILTNKAHGYIFSGQATLANGIYLNNANRIAVPNDPNSKTFGASVLDDFDEFRKHPHFNMKLAAISNIEERLKNNMSRAVQQAAVPQNSVKQ